MIRVGIIGTGRIANRFVPEAACVAEVQVVSVYNPHESSAVSFGEAHGLEVFSDLEAFFASMDAVYVASPHETHVSYTKQALNAGKHVLCEKPMAFSQKDARELFDLAHDKGLVLMEGLKTAYAPGYEKIMKLVKSGCIGEVKYIEACFTKLVEETGREFADTGFGGSFTELGSYVLLPVLSVFGTEYTDVSFDSVRNAKGLDVFTRATIRYNSSGGKADIIGCDRFASVICGLGVKSEGRLMISGTKGYILVEAPWWKPTHISVHYEDASKENTYECEFLGDGLRYELEKFSNRTNSNDIGEDEYSIALASVMEKFLKTM